MWVTFPDSSHLTDGLLITDFRSLPPKEISKRNSKSGPGRLASGYDPTWLTLNKAKQGNVGKHGILEDVDKTAIGGFADEDIFDERPNPGPQAGSDKSQISNQVRRLRNLTYFKLNNFKSSRMSESLLSDAQKLLWQHIKVKIQRKPRPADPKSRLS